MNRPTPWLNQMISLLACGLLLSLGSGVSGQRGSPESAAQSDELPIYARYDILFRRLIAPPNRNQNGKDPQQGKSPQYLAILQHAVPLSDEETNALNRIATECMQRIGDLDERAQQLIQTYRAQNPPRRLAPGEQRALPPPELQSLQQERNNLILEARQQVRIAFGEAEFQRFEQYVNSHGAGRRFTLPSPNKQPLPVQVTVTALDNDGIATKQFTVGARLFIQVTMLNNSAQTITVRQAELYDWFQLLRLQDDGRSEELPLLPLGKSPDESKETSSIEIQPGQPVIVGRLELGGGMMKLGVGQYRFAPHQTVLLNRPPDKSEFLRFSLTESDAVTFQIVQ